MRLGEIVSLRRNAIKVVLKDGSESDLRDMKEFPSEVTGLLLHLPWRKNHVTQDCWIPVACDQVIHSIFQQVTTLRAIIVHHHIFSPHADIVKVASSYPTAVTMSDISRW